MQGPVLHPPIKWAQRKNRVYLTVEIRDIKEEKIDLQANQLNFKGTSDNQNFEFQLNFFDEVVVEESKWNITGFALLFILAKKNDNKPYWKRLTQEEKKFQHITVDWNKYIDEDDEQEEGNKGLQDWDQDKFQDFDQGKGDEDDEDDGQFNKGNVDDLEEEQEVEQQQHQHDENCKHE